MATIRFIGLFLTLIALWGCGSADATGPSQSCVINQDPQNSSSSSATVGDTTLNCTKSKDSHDSTAPAPGV